MSELNKESVFIITSNGSVKLFPYETLCDNIRKIVEMRKLNHVDCDLISKRVYQKLKEHNTLEEIESQIVATASEMIIIHYDYSSIAIHLIITDLHRRTNDDYLVVTNKLYDNYVNGTISANIHGDFHLRSQNKKKSHKPVVSLEFKEFVEKHRDAINNALDYERDFNMEIFGFRTLEKTYLKRLADDTLVERPQHLFMRVAISLHRRSDDIEKVINTYNLISQGYYTHATPTLYNAGTTREQMSSCFLLGIDDSMESIGECQKDCMLISKYSGGIGLNVSCLRAEGAYIASTQGRSSGLRVAKVFEAIAKYADQGGKRSGSIAIYCEPWHGDIEFFLQLKKNTGAESERTRDLFLALTINDIFMQRVDNDEKWSLMCPSECGDLINLYGEEFTAKYIEHENKGEYIRQVDARDLWFKILESQIETGVPYILYKDATNFKSNHKNIGVIKNSNLCIEIVQYCDANEYAVCNLASLCLPKYVKEEKTLKGVKMVFDYQKLYEVARIATRNLNTIIDINFYPVEKTRISNMKHRPIGLGVQGLADVFALFKTPFDSPLARDMNKKIFETIYFASMTESMELAKEHGYYQSYPGSPISQGLFQFELWGLKSSQLSGMWDWETLRKSIMKYGIRNSLTTACMPTATTAQIMGNNECFEPYTNNLYNRKTLAGTYYIINRHLMKDLMELGLWNESMINLIKYNRGSVQNIPQIPTHLKEIYRNVWEISQKSIIDMAADRGPFIDQTQSMNIFMEKPEYKKLSASHFYSWKKGLKTGIYYLRSKAATEAIQFGIDAHKIQEIEKTFSRTISDSDSNDVSEQSNSDTPICVYRPAHLRDEEVCDVCSA